MDNYELRNAEAHARLDRIEKIIETTAIESAKSRQEIEGLLQSLKETRKEVNGLGNSYGKHAESYFFESLKKSKQFGGIIYDFVDDDYKGSNKLPDGQVINGQFDIVMHNGDSLAIIEVKSKVQQNDVKDLVNRKINDFKKIFPQYANNKFFLGIAGFSFEKGAEDEALSSGVGILKLSGENVEIKDKHLIVY